MLNMIHIVVFQIKWKENAYGFNWVIITTILLKQHKITAFDASSQVQTTVVVCCQIVEVQVDLGNNLIRRTCCFFCLVTLRKSIEISNRTMKKLKCTPKTVHSSALWAILSVRYECYLKKKRANCTFLFASLAIVDRLKSGDLKERRLSWGVSGYFSTFGLLLCCLPAGVVPGRSGLLKFPCSSTQSQSEAAPQASTASSV